MARDYRKEYDTYHAKPEQKKNRAKRNAAREKMVKAGVVKKGDGLEIDHKKAIRNGGGNGRGNLRPLALKANRAWRKGQKGQL